MNEKKLRESIQKEIKMILAEAAIDPYMSVAGIATSIHEIKRQFEEIMSSNMIPDEAAITEIKNAYAYLKKTSEIVNTLLPRYQNMGMQNEPKTKS